MNSIYSNCWICSIWWISVTIKSLLSGAALAIYTNLTSKQVLQNKTATKGLNYCLKNTCAKTYSGTCDVIHWISKIQQQNISGCRLHWLTQPCHKQKKRSINGFRKTNNWVEFSPVSFTGASLFEVLNVWVCAECQRNLVETLGRRTWLMAVYCKHEYS